MTSPIIPGLQIYISKAAISIADGFSLPCSAPMGTHATPPYKGVVTPGWTLDEKGQAMSKSRGNDVDPVDISSRLEARLSGSGWHRSTSVKMLLVRKR